MMLLARRPKDAIPDASHPGKAEEKSPGKASFPLGIFPAFLGQKPSIFRNPIETGGSCLVNHFM